MKMVKALKCGLKCGLWLILVVFSLLFLTIAFLVMEYGHYLGVALPFWLLPFLPIFLAGRLMRRSNMAWFLGAGLPFIGSLGVYLIFFVRRSGEMRLGGWMIDLWPKTLLLAGFIMAALFVGRWLRTQSKTPRRWATVGLIIFSVFGSVFQVYRFLSGMIGDFPLKIDLSNKTYDQAIVALGDFFRKNYNYLEYKGVDWDKVVEGAAAAARQAKTEEEYYEVVSGLITQLGDSHLRVRRSGEESRNPQEIELGVRWVELENRWFVENVTEGSPAAKAGIRRGAELLNADGRLASDLIASAPDWRFSSKFGTIRGQRFGGRTRLAFMLRRPAGALLNLMLDGLGRGRHKVEVRFEDWKWPKGKYFESYRLSGNIGYIRIGQFVSNILGLIWSFDRALEELWDTRGLIIDVRNNPGGIGFITDTMLDRFCRQRIRYGGLRSVGPRSMPLYVMPRRPLYQEPVVVIINENDFSASELFAFTASSVSGVTLVGRPTGGVVSAPSQRSIYLPAGLRLEFTFGILRDEKGRLVVEWTGVQPDVLVPQMIEDLQSGRDREIEEALDILSRKSALTGRPPRKK